VILPEPINGFAAVRAAMRAALPFEME